MLASEPVLDRVAPSFALALAEFKTDEVRSALVKFARGRTRSEADAEDLIANALAASCDPRKSPWDRGKCTFEHHMKNLMRRRAVEDHRSWNARNVVADSDQAAYEDVEAQKT